jgi:hypothetical protein
MTRLLVTLCAAGLLGSVPGCAAELGADDDGSGEVLAPPLTADELAALPGQASDLDHVDLAVLDTATVDDPAAFADEEVAEFDDVPVDDNDDPLDDSGDVTSTVGFSPRAAILRSGLHPRASDALRAAGVTAAQITQTIGGAAASAGTHAQDGTVNGHAYSAATDVSVRGLSHTQIKNLLARLAKVGFVAWFRFPGHDGWPSSEAPHLHIVYANSKMKSSLRSQVRSWLVHRNGLVSNTIYTFYTWSAANVAIVANKFAQSASGTTNAGTSCVVGGSYCGGDKLAGDRNTLYRCTGEGAPTKIRACVNGCSVNPGRNDSCR